MTKDEKNILIQQSVKLTTLGVKVERERKKLKNLVKRGIPYSSPEMLVVLKRFERCDAEWKRLEAEHLALRNRLKKI